MTVAPRRSLAILFGWLLLVALAASTGVLTPPGAWYAELQKPPLTPPDWLFPVAWTVLYLMMAVAAWRVTLRVPAGERLAVLWPFVTQLAANGLWSILFFGLHWIVVALADLLLLWCLILLSIIRFARVSPLAAWLLTPYLVWVSFAGYLNAGIGWLNG
ncbi:tryptophan-rich sensory protein [Halomonas sp. MCCC 1A17488]|uniref:Tryptophan-rich sensory protein n=1 Tax=Billgrantia sulfidoxydans TaxID=2733484 RepID=A0ABX7VZI9_9GAMM|nr:MULTISPECIES: TspO/MBR family protein [Halomonas]MCE8016927.1 tryptophan-rich sensory protein [Halomonas sp. MCCC 1A17488]MCG3240260.1 tryptophan-rich sensory protein [Halomonas sp. MCCC 1A17488]QPP49864.1 tryptophan-rich sensory protein [Halomonas sp. SS10-MC5]QTP53485.1 tryptophan-rich sensory protein [Halomonas sulfidoxydans]